MLLTLLAVWATSNVLSAAAATQHYECIIHGTDGKPILNEVGPGLIIPTAYYFEVSSEAMAVSEALKSAKSDSVPAGSAKCTVFVPSREWLQMRAEHKRHQDAEN